MSKTQQTQTAGHTPGPWKQCKKEDGTDEIWPIPYNGGMGRICTLTNGLRSEANAAYIVLAVNAHKKLVEALDDLISALCIYSNPNEGDNVARHILKAKEALKAAGAA